MKRQDGTTFVGTYGQLFGLPEGIYIRVEIEGNLELASLIDGAVEDSASLWICKNLEATCPRA